MIDKQLDNRRVEYNREYFVEMGKAGNRAFMKNTTKKQRIANAKKAAKASAIARRANSKKISTGSSE